MRSLEVLLRRPARHSRAKASGARSGCHPGVSFGKRQPTAALQSSSERDGETMLQGDPSGKGRRAASTTWVARERRAYRAID